MNTEKLVLKGLTKTFGTATAVDHIDLSIREGELVSFLGPSGCGKTTTLRMIAGLETPTDGQIIVDGIVMSDSKRQVLPEKREMGMMFQSYAVWPHMTVWDNVAYGLKIKRLPKAELIERTGAMLDMVGLLALKDRFPTQLSGGQQQRVALARALANHPRILLLDEPLCNLDAKLREAMRFEIRALQQRLGITAVYVTHSQDEALAVSDELVIMRGGKILQRGTPEDVYLTPNSVFVADFIGLIDDFPVRVAAADEGGFAVEPANGRRLYVARGKTAWKAGDGAHLLVRPESISLSPTETGEGNEMPARIEKVSFTGSVVDYFLCPEGIEGNFRAQNLPPVRYHEGDRVWMRFEPGSCSLTEQ